MHRVINNLKKILKNLHDKIEYREKKNISSNY